jgi:SAM-dependent methyltransferase
MVEHRGGEPSEQFEMWNGDEGRNWVTYQDAHDQMVGALTPHLLQAAAIAESDRVLDVGCGCGETTRLAAVRAASGRVLGVDLSAPMLEAASNKARRAGLGERVDFVQADAQTYPFEGASFDVLLSRFGVMFFADATTAFANLARAIRPGGRLAFLCWQAPLKNEWIATAGAALATYVPLPDLGGDNGAGPFSLADPDRVRALLVSAGFSSIGIEPVLEPVVLGRTVNDAVGYVEDLGVVRSMMAGVNADTVRHAMVALADALNPFVGPTGVCLGSAAWLVTARIRDDAP